MMDYQLTIPSILRRARDVHPHKTIVTKMNDESIHTETYGQFYRRTRQLMDALRRAGIKPGDRIGTAGMNHYRHLEVYFAAPSMGAVLHTINVRLFPEQLIYIINNAGDRIIFVDKSLTKMIAAQIDQIKGVERFVIMDDLEAGEAAPLPGAMDYEDFLATGDLAAADVEDTYSVNENDAAGLCYTSGTTGNPRGVVYSHRSIYLHSMAICMADTLGVSERETILPVVPMFHVNAWGIPFAAVMTGAKLVLPGKHLLGAALASFLEQEKVTMAAGVPTIWNVLLQHLRKNKHDLSSLHTMVVGGSAAPKAMIEAYDKEFGIRILHAWGMTELSPVGTVSRLRKEMEDWPYEKQLAMRSKQGPPVAGIEIRAIDDEGRDVPADGKTPGELVVRGPWVTGSYFGIDAPESFTADGWFRTGDVVTIDEFGYVTITDRKKDLIKTRGEWVSSVEMEGLVLAVPGVLEAAVVARPDDVRGEAPVIFIVAREGETVEKRAVIEELKKHFAHWQLPHLDDVHIVDAIPKTSVGKFDKKALRARLASE
jgi:fatty-acyl-CoA synthase